MPVEGPRNYRFDGDVPKTVHGVTSASLMVSQVVDPKGYRKVIFLVKIDSADGEDKLFTFPESMWSQLGVPPKWLLDGISKFTGDKTEDEDTSEDESLIKNNTQVVDVLGGSQ